MARCSFLAELQHLSMVGAKERSRVGRDSEGSSRRAILEVDDSVGLDALRCEVEYPPFDRPDRESPVYSPPRHPGILSESSPYTATRSLTRF